MYDYTCRVVFMWCPVLVVQGMLCVGGIVYMSCMWFYVRVVLCTCRAYGVMYIRCHIHVMHVVMCTCAIVHIFYSGEIKYGVVHTLCRWCRVHAML